MPKRPKTAVSGRPKKNPGRKRNLHAPEPSNKLALLSLVFLVWFGSHAIRDVKDILLGFDSLIAAFLIFLFIYFCSQTHGQELYDHFMRVVKVFSQLVRCLFPNREEAKGFQTKRTDITWLPKLPAIPETGRRVKELSFGGSVLVFGALFASIGISVVAAWFVARAFTDPQVPKITRIDPFEERFQLCVRSDSKCGMGDNGSGEVAAIPSYPFRDDAPVPYRLVSPREYGDSSKGHYIGLVPELRRVDRQ